MSAENDLWDREIPEFMEKAAHETNYKQSSDLVLRALIDLRKEIQNKPLELRPTPILESKLYNHELKTLRKGIKEIASKYHFGSDLQEMMFESASLLLKNTKELKK